MSADNDFSPLCRQLRRYLNAKRHIGIVWDYKINDWGEVNSVDAPTAIGFSIHAGSYVSVVNPEMLQLRDRCDGKATWAAHLRLPFGHTYEPLTDDRVTDLAAGGPAKELYVEVLCDFGKLQ